MDRRYPETATARTKVSNESTYLPIDNLSAEVIAMRHAATMAREWGQRYAELRALVTDRMGAAEVATIAGRPVARYTTTTARRISSEAVRRLPAELVDAVTVETVSRRFVLVDADGGTSA